MKNFNPIDTVWTEKWRPKRVKDMVGDFKDKILAHLENPKAVPNFLFYSISPGTGKTSLSGAIINELDCDALILNSADDRKIDTIRDKVKEFALTKSSKEGKKRAVILDEADHMTFDSANALRNTMETYASNVFFIMTANKVNRIAEPLRSRCIEIPFAQPQKEEIKKYLIKIMDAEKMDYADDALSILIDLNYPSIRNMVLQLQDLHAMRLPLIKENVKPANQVFDDMWQAIKTKDWEKIKQTIFQSALDARELNTFFWNKFLEESNIKGIQLAASNEKAMSSGADAKIILISSLFEMVK